MVKKKVLKEALIDIVRVNLFFLVTFLPLIFILVSTGIFVKFFNMSSFPLFINIIISFLFLLAVSRFIAYFFGNYGSVYKLLFLTLIRNDIEQLLVGKYRDIYMPLLASSSIYIIVIINLLIDFLNTPSLLSKVVVGIVLALMLVYVLPNKKYENVINLANKIWKNDGNKWNDKKGSGSYDVEEKL